MYNVHSTYKNYNNFILSSNVKLQTYRPYHNSSFFIVCSVYIFIPSLKSRHDKLIEYRLIDILFRFSWYKVGNYFQSISPIIYIRYWFIFLNKEAIASIAQKKNYIIPTCLVYSLLEKNDTCVCCHLPQENNLFLLFTIDSYQKLNPF